MNIEGESYKGRITFHKHKQGYTRVDSESCGM